MDRGRVWVVVALVVAAVAGGVWWQRGQGDETRRRALVEAAYVLCASAVDRGPTLTTSQHAAALVRCAEQAEAAYPSR